MINNKIILSACLVVHNEEMLIERCLKSLEGLVDEIIVVHDGICEDKTLAIAQAYGAKIFVQPFCGEPDPLFPFAYSQTRGEWILRIDADEFLSHQLQNNIIKLLKVPSISAYEFLWPLFNGEEYKTINWPYKLCLFRKSRISFLGIPHFTTEVKGEIKKLPYLLEHRPLYNNYSWKIFRKKWIPWAKIQAELYLKDFQEIKKYNYEKTNWPFSVRFRRVLPLFALVIDPCIVILRTFTSGAWKEGTYGWRSAALHICLKMTIDWNIFIRKHQKI